MRWRSSFLIAGWVVLALGAAELAFRIGWVKRIRLGAGIGHPHFHHRLTPNTTFHFESQEFRVDIRTNSYGLRGPDPLVPKPPGTVRVLMMGDSFTFGFPVQDHETFSTLVARALSERHEPVDIVNGGVSGYSTTLHYISLRDQFLQFDPDLVVLWYDLSDLQEDYWYRKNVIRDPQGRILRCDPSSIDGRFNWWGWLINRSAFIKYFDTKVLRTAKKIRVLGLNGYLAAKWRGERSKVAIARLKQQQLVEDLPAYDQFLLVRETSTVETMQPYWQLSEQYLRMIHALLQERGIPLMLGIYPYGMLVGPEQWAGGRESWGFDRGRTYEATTFVTLMQRFCEAEDIPLVNSIESFRQAAPSATLFYDGDGHFTAAGHHVLAQHLLRDEGFNRLLRHRLEREGADRFSRRR